MSCIKNFWDEEDQKIICSCPQCRQTFIPRPLLVKNTMLADLMEELKKTELQAAAAPLKKHKLVDLSKKLQENVCSCHDEVMKMFCHTDQQVICYLCSVDEHKGHDTVSAAAERTESQKELQEDLKVLQQQVEAINHSADKAVRDSEEIFKELIHLMEKRSSEVKQQIRSQQETEVSRAAELQEKMQQEIKDLRRKDAELQQLSLTDDHVQFLHNYSSMSRLRDATDSARIKICPLSY
ncbi:hypothetical protein LDENG_00298640, partial [Lucifuga dentata]